MTNIVEMLSVIFRYYATVHGKTAEEEIKCRHYIKVIDQK